MARRPAAADRHAFVRALLGRPALGGISTVLPAFLGAARGDGSLRRAAGPTAAGVRRWPAAGFGHAAAALVDALHAGTGTSLARSRSLATQARPNTRAADRVRQLQPPQDGN